MGCCSSKEAHAEDMPAGRPRKLQGETRVLGSGSQSGPPKNLTPAQMSAARAEARAQQNSKKVASNKKLLGDASARERQQRDADAQRQWTNFN